MIFVVRRLQENGKAGVSFFMCFIDLQKAYDTVDRTLLWQVLTRIDISSQMVAVIRQFYDAMRACVRPDDGVCLDRFEVEQGLRQGCGLSQLLFHNFFRSRTERCPSNIQRGYGPELVHLKEPPRSIGDRSPVWTTFVVRCGVSRTRITPV